MLYRFLFLFVLSFNAIAGVSIVPERGDDGLPLNREQKGSKGFHYQYREVIVQTASKTGVILKDWYDNDLDYADIDFYDSNGFVITASTQNEIDLNAVETRVKIQFPFQVDIIRGRINWVADLSEGFAIGVIIAEHIPRSFGGQVEFIPRVDLSLVSQKEFRIEGSTIKEIKHDPINLSNQWTFKLKHQIGEKVKIKVGLEYFKSPLE